MRIVQGKKYCTNCINCNTGWKCHVNRLANSFAESGAEAGLLLLEYGLGVRIDRVLYTLGLSGSDFTCSMQFWSSLIVTLMRRANWSKPSTPCSAKDFLAALPLFLSTAENCSSKMHEGNRGRLQESDRRQGSCPHIVRVPSLQSWHRMGRESAGGLDRRQL